MLSMPRVELALLDIDWTLVHNEKPADGIEIKGEPGSWLARETIAGVEALAQHALIYLATGRSENQYRRVGPLLPHNGVILEHGGRILHDGVEDAAWQERFAHLTDVTAGTLWEYHRKFEGSGFFTVHAGRRASFGILHAGDQYDDDPIKRLPHDLEENVKLAFEEAPKPPGVLTVRTGRGLDVVVSTKGDAMDHVAKRYGLERDQIAAVGDDLNDITMLQRAGFPCTIFSAHSVILDVVDRRKGFLSFSGYHDGIQEVLRYLNKQATTR
jgi:HAD superfamily hydrolase (TIGR01484 family)